MIRFYKKSLLFLFAVFSFSIAIAQAPQGYYSSAQGLYGTQLQQELHDIIDGHTVLGYDYLWTVVEDTDPRPGNSNLVWDMYSDIPGGTPPYTFTFGVDQCGNYSGEGSCYNREHSWPKSWFNDASPMETDIVLVVPTDGYVNGMRSNFPYGDVDNATWTSQNGSKLGYTNATWTSDKVFEPIDEYKGDFARIYFYISVRYYGEDGSFISNDMVNGSQLKQDPLDLLIQWHQDDPVSQKEIDRNNEIYNYQGNRNPFVDHPEYVDDIWISQGIDGDKRKANKIYVKTNSSNDELKISITDYKGNIYTAEIYDICGKKVKKFRFSSEEKLVNISNLHEGYYFCKIMDNKNGIRVTKKILHY